MIVIAEIPGITPPVADFARRVVDNGFTVVMPVLFGDAGAAADRPRACEAIDPGVRLRGSSRPSPPSARPR